ncbi:DUF202 domain-containing protein [Arthrobacter sp. LAPM80]|uniref:DUF202 domain-containing protein n=1 Tax=Arthrobacter sp. LAPM80 TaxID=3141788 RepID=UPI00398B7F23
MGEGTEEAGPAPSRDPGLQPERTALAWRRTIMSAVIADILIWRGWFHALGRAGSQRNTDGLFTEGHSAHVIALGVCVMVASLTTVVLVACAILRIRTLHAGVGVLGHSSGIAPGALMLRTASAAIVALAVATMCALALGF